MKHSFQKVLSLLNFGSCPGSMNSANVVAENQFKSFNERALKNIEHRRTLNFELRSLKKVSK